MESIKNPGLIDAAMKGDEDVLIAMIEAGFDIDVKNKAGMTAVMWAAANGQKKCLARLIGAGCDVDAKDEDDWTAAMWAAVNGQEECLARLIAAGCNVDAKNNEGKTAGQLSVAGSECQGMISAELERKSLMMSAGSGKAQGAKRRAGI